MGSELFPSKRNIFSTLKLLKKGLNAGLLSDEEAKFIDKLRSRLEGLIDSSQPSAAEFEAKYDPSPFESVEKVIAAQLEKAKAKPKKTFAKALISFHLLALSFLLTGIAYSIKNFGDFSMAFFVSMPFLAFVASIILLLSVFSSLLIILKGQQIYRNRERWVLAQSYFEYLLKETLGAIKDIENRHKTIDEMAPSLADSEKIKEEGLNEILEKCNGVAILSIHQHKDFRVGDARGHCFGYVAIWAKRFLTKESFYGVDTCEPNAHLLESVPMVPLMHSVYEAQNAQKDDVALYKALYADEVDDKAEELKEHKREIKADKNEEKVKKKIVLRLRVEKNLSFYRDLNEVVDTLCKTADRNPDRIYNLNISRWENGHAFGFCKKCIEKNPERGIAEGAEYHFFDPSGKWVRFNNEKDFKKWFKLYFERMGCAGYKEYGIRSYAVRNKLLDSDDFFPNLSAEGWQGIPVLSHIFRFIYYMFVSTKNDIKDFFLSMGKSESGWEALDPECELSALGSKFYVRETDYNEEVWDAKRITQVLGGVRRNSSPELEEAFTIEAKAGISTPIAPVLTGASSYGSMGTSIPLTGVTSQPIKQDSPNNTLQIHDNPSPH